MARILLFLLVFTSLPERMAQATERDPRSAQVNPPRWRLRMQSLRRKADYAWNRRNVFKGPRLRQAVADGVHPLIEMDSASPPQFVSIAANDNRRARVHLLAITLQDPQPINLFDMQPGSSDTLGRMVRSMMNAPRLAHVQAMSEPSHFNRWTTSISLPGKLSIPYFHVHGENKVHHGVQPTIDTARVVDWDQFALTRGYRVDAGRSNGDFRVYRPSAGAFNRWRAIVVANKANGTPAELSAKTDRLIGEMFLAGSAVVMSEAEDLPGGHIEMMRDDQQLVVRVADKKPLRRRAREIRNH